MNLNCDGCRTAAVVIGLVIGNDDSDSLTVKTEYVVLAYGDLKCGVLICIDNAAENLANEHYVIECGSRKLRGVTVNTDNEAVTGANLNYGRDEIELKDILFDHIVSRNSPLIVALTLDGNGDCACACKIGGYSSVSLKGHDIISAGVKGAIINNYADIRLLLIGVIVYATGYVNVGIVNGIALDYVFLGNLYYVIGIIVTDTLDENGDRTCICKVGGYNAVSEVSNYIINTLNEYLGTNLNKGIRLLLGRIVNGVS